MYCMWIKKEAFCYCNISWVVIRAISEIPTNCCLIYSGNSMIYLQGYWFAGWALEKLYVETLNIKKGLNSVRRFFIEKLTFLFNFLSLNFW